MSTHVTRLPALVLVLLVLSAPVVSAGFITNVARDVPENATEWNTQRKLVRAVNGDLYATFLAEGEEEPRVVVERSTQGGRRWERIPDPPIEDQAFRPALAASIRGGVWLGWTEFVPDLGHHQVFVARFAGGEWSAPERLSATRGYSGFPSLAVEPVLPDVEDPGVWHRGEEERLHVAWYGLDQGSYRVFHRVRDVNGTWSPPARLTSGIPDALNPSLALGPDRVLHAVWSKEERATYQVWYARYADGNWTTPRLLTRGPDHMMNPVVVTDASNVVRVAWDGRDGNGDRRVWLASAEGGRFEGLGGTPVSYDGEDASYPTMTVADGLAVIAWTSFRGIRVAEEQASGGFRIVATLGLPGARDAHLRWQTPHDDPYAVDLVFTQATGSRVTVRYAQEPFAGLAGGIPAAGVTALVAALAAGALVVPWLTGGRAASPRDVRPRRRGP